MMGIVYLFVLCGIGYFILLCVSSAERKQRAERDYNAIRSAFKPSEFPDSSWFYEGYRDSPEYQEYKGRQLKRVLRYEKPSTGRRYPGRGSGR